MHTSIAVTDGTLTIHSLEVQDDITVAYIRQLQPEAQAAGVANCLQLGARALTFTSDQTGATLLADSLKNSTESTRALLSQVSATAEQSVTKSAETLEKFVAQQLTDLGKELDKKLDPSNTASIIGRLRSSLLDDYGKVTAKVREDLDLANPLSPLSALRSELDKNEERRYDALAKQLAGLLQELAAKTAAKAERSKSTRKGSDFETATADFLMAESRPRKDLVRHTASEYGLDQNMVGDFVIDINPGEAQGVRVVIESKNGHKGMTELTRELDKAMKNRGAAFGIAVVTDENAIAQAIYPWGDDKLIVRVPALLDDDGWDFAALSVALEGARWKAIMGRMTAGSLDVNRIKADITDAFAIANRFAEVKKRITAGKGHLDAIAEYLGDIKRDLVTVLHRIDDTVSEAEPTSEAA
jgi:hypothetical protein